LGLFVVSRSINSVSRLCTPVVCVDQLIGGDPFYKYGILFIYIYIYNHECRIRTIQSGLCSQTCLCQVVVFRAMNVVFCLCIPPMSADIDTSNMICVVRLASGPTFKCKNRQTLSFCMLRFDSSVSFCKYSIPFMYSRLQVQSSLHTKLFVWLDIIVVVVSRSVNILSHLSKLIIWADYYW